MKIATAFVFSLIITTLSISSSFSEDLPSGQEARVQQLIAIQKSLKPKYDTVQIPLAEATLQLGKDYYFLNSEDSRKVIVDAWKNPPSSANNVLGMIFKDGVPMRKVAGENIVEAFVMETEKLLAEQKSKTA